MDFHNLLTYIKQKAALFSAAFCLIIKWQPIIDMFRNFEVEECLVKLLDNLMNDTENSMLRV
jgi:hypothetical protein